MAAASRSDRVQPCLLFLVSEDWYFVSHRLRLAEAALQRGYRVILVARFAAHRDLIERAGIETVPFNIGRSGTNPAGALLTLARLRRLYRRLAPDLVYQVALKPVLLGSLAARLAGVRRRVDALGGLGFLFGEHSGRQAPLRAVARLAMGRLLRGDEIIVQNEDDRALLLRSGLPAPRLHLIPGAGVDLERFRALPEPAARPVVITLVSRMLWEKGVGELVEAARLLARRGVAAQVRLVGRPDPENPRTIAADRLAAWDAEGVVEWRGARDDIPAVWAESHVAVLPSYYREGLPKALMEAAACGRPIVTTDRPGCRDAVLPGESGLLVPARDPAVLADALERLVEDGALRRRMGARARQDAEQRFSDALINGRILDLCDGLLARAAAG